MEGGPILTTPHQLIVLKRMNRPLREDKYGDIKAYIIRTDIMKTLR